MKKLILILFTLPHFLFAQSYKSIFNQNLSVNYSILGRGLFDNHTGTIGINGKDSVFAGKTWKMMDGQSDYAQCFGFVSEDTLTGKVWFKSLGIGALDIDTAIKLIADFSLNFGDTFLYHVKLDYWQGPTHFSDSSNNWLKVDSVFYKNGLKHIRFDTTGIGMRLYIIEGVGTNFLPSYMSTLPVYIQCCYKSGNLFYKNHYSRIPDSCEIMSLSGGIDDIFNSNFQSQKVYPNPTNNFISISNFKNGKVEIINSLGQLILTTSQTENINIENLPQGIYWIRFADENNILRTSKFIKQ